MEKTICAISTPLGKGAISIVRMSGKDSLLIMKDIFSSKTLDYDKITPRMLYFGKLELSGEIKENCLAVYFKGPNSYTGEDMVEFQVHGGTLLTQRVLERLLEKGAALAQGGEFTKRAFENGKVSLDMAESIIGEINAESESELKASLSLAEGRLNKKIKDLQNELLESIARIEAMLDYPEEDFEQAEKDEIFAKIHEISFEIDKFIENSRNSRYISQGINVAIVGSPNVGKSSLLNSLIGEDRAIVTDIAGTTRDVLTETITYEGVKINFIDTAGIRESEDKVEKIGIEKSKKSIDNADVVLFVVDGSRVMDDYDKQIKSLLENKNNVITIVNKSDLPRKSEKNEQEIEISALREKNIDLVKDKIYKLVINEELDFNKEMLINARQIEILNQCKDIIVQILNCKNESMDVVALLVKNLWNCLGRITGETENETIIDLIFEKFCLGK